MSQIAINVYPGNLRTSEAVNAWVERSLRPATRRFEGRVTRIEVHFGDLNGPKQGASDMRCAMEARVNGRSPVAVEHRAEDLYEAIDGAARKLRAAVARALDRVAAREQRRARTPHRPGETAGVRDPEPGRVSPARAAPRAEGTGATAGARRTRDRA